MTKNRNEVIRALKCCIKDAEDSLCGAGEVHATSMVGNVPYCWKCGADMMEEPK